jgi:hypothetical protein
MGGRDNEDQQREPTTEVRLQKYFHLMYMESSYCKEKRVPKSD